MINDLSHYEDVWESEGIAPPFFPSSLDLGERLASRSWRFTPRKQSPLLPDGQEAG
jgi:hypothetical protein